MVDILFAKWLFCEGVRFIVIQNTVPIFLKCLAFDNNENITVRAGANLLVFGSKNPLQRMKILVE